MFRNLLSGLKKSFFGTRRKVPYQKKNQSKPWLELLESRLAPTASATLSGFANTDNTWITGNIGASKASYVEGDSVPYRIVITGVAPSTTYSLTINYDTTKAGKHAFD